MLTNKIMIRLVKFIAILSFCLLSGCVKSDKKYVGTWIDSYDLGILGTQSTDLTLYED